MTLHKLNTVSIIIQEYAKIIQKCHTQKYVKWTYFPTVFLNEFPLPAQVAQFCLDINEVQSCRDDRDNIEIL